MSKIKKLKDKSMKNEIITAIIAFFTCSYIIVVNSKLLEVAGIPLKWSIVATTIVCAISCILIGFYAKAPLIIIPGVGETIFFTFTIVKSHNYSYQEALAIVLFSGIIFLLISLTPIVSKMSFSIPDSLKTSITIGIGIFMAFVGLQNSGIVVGNKQTMVSLSEWDLTLVTALLVLLLSLILFTAKIKLAFLYTIIIGSIISFLSGIAEYKERISFFNMSSVINENAFLSFSFQKIEDFSFWSLVFSLTILILFQNIGTINGITNLDKAKINKTFKAIGLSNVISSLLGVSSTVVAVESATVTHMGAKKGRVIVIVGIMFLLSLLFLPLIMSIPSIAISPILIIIGSLMFINIRTIDFEDMSEYIPCYITIIMIPLTYDIATGMGFGFISYVIINLFKWNIRKLNPTIIVIALMFVLSYLFG